MLTHRHTNRKDAMNKTYVEQYQEKMASIHQMLSLLMVEAEHAKNAKTHQHQEIDAADIAEQQEILSLLIEAYKIFCADAIITNDEVLRQAQELAADDRN